MARAFDADGYMDAWRRRDLARILDHHAEAATLEDPLMGQVARGKEYLRRHVGAQMPSMEEVTIEPRLLVQEGDKTAALVHVGIHYAGNIHHPSGIVIPVRGKRLSLDFGIFLESDEDGKIRHETWVFDLAKAMRQMDLREELIEQTVREAPFADLGVSTR